MKKFLQRIQQIERSPGQLDRNLERLTRQAPSRTIHVLTSGGQHQGQGKISRQGDRLLRSLIMQGANSLCIMRERMPDCPWKHWQLRQRNAAKPRNKELVSAAAKRLRLVYAVLMTRELFSRSKAARFRSAPPFVLPSSPPAIGHRARFDIDGFLQFMVIRQDAVRVL